MTSYGKTVFLMWGPADHADTLMFPYLFYTTPGQCHLSTHTWPGTTPVTGLPGTLRSAVGSLGSPDALCLWCFKADT